MGLREVDLVKDYTGHTYDPVLNKYYAKARLYDAESRRFMAADPVKGSVTSPISLNPYVYVLNNPLGYTDPSGCIAAEDTDFISHASLDIQGNNYFYDTYDKNTIDRMILNDIHAPVITPPKTSSVVVGKNDGEHRTLGCEPIDVVINDRNGTQVELTSEDYLIITERAIVRVNKEAITTHWEFGVGIAGAVKTPIGDADVGIKLITFNGDFQGGENYAVFGEGSLYGAVDVPGIGNIVKMGSSVRNVLPNHVSDGYIEEDFDLIRLTLLEKTLSDYGSFDLDIVGSLSDAEQDILTNVLNSLDIDGGGEAYLFIGFGIEGGINPGKIIRIVQEEYMNYER